MHQWRLTYRRRLRRVSARMIPITLIRKTRPAAAAIAILSRKEGKKRVRVNNLTFDLFLLFKDNMFQHNFKIKTN